MTTVILKSGREFTALRRHPWIFSGAVERLEGPEPASGETVSVQAADGEALGLGAWSPASQIRIRLWTFGAGGAVDAAFFAQRLAVAAAARRALPPPRRDTDALRLVNAESDGLPGLVVDRYGEFLVCQFAAAGVERWKAEIVAALQQLQPCAGIYERSDLDAREREGLPPATGVLAGAEPPACLEIREHGCIFGVDVRHGHKTGFYLDQRDNRALVAAHASGRAVLNAFAYSGGFGVAALKAGAASVAHVDLSAPALELARANTARNGVDAATSEFVEGNVFEVLRTFRDSRRSFDLVVLAPPKFVESKGHLMAACRGYKDINLLGLKLLRPGGLLATFSCSGLLAPELFHKIVSDAAVDARRDVRVLQRLGAAPDHADSLTFPEGLYLKGLLCRVE
jgi:23S rRNA (cytosine1962-C5)-methyltransferase